MMPVFLLIREALAHHFVKEKGRGGGDVKGVGGAEHGDAHGEIGLRHPSFAEPILLCPHDDGEGDTEISLRKEKRCVGSGRDDGDLLLLEEREGAGGICFDDGQGEESSDAGADDVGIVDVGGGIADDDGVDPSSIARAEDGAEIARLFDALGDEEKRGFGFGEDGSEIAQRAVKLRRNREKAVGSVTVGDLREYFFGTPKSLRIGLLNQCLLIFAEEKLRTDI